MNYDENLYRLVIWSFPMVSIPECQEGKKFRAVQEGTLLGFSFQINSWLAVKFGISSSSDHV
jgi:hypothetical protein